MDRSGDWLRQAEYDIQTAIGLAREGRHAWACFVAQQSAEKSLKAVLEKMGLPSWGHDLIELLRAIEQRLSFDNSLRESCHRLNLYYIAARYPDAFSSGVPEDKFSKEQSASALRDAQEVLVFASEAVHQQ
ncbi:MAG: HEPN domain-containing protein [Candidatus Thorarchaeota archaeon]|nr:HEPN domain-containing protein [Candidatus Thorarchaeota archaeon]